MKQIALVVPSIRKESFERFIHEWGPMGLFDKVDLILVEDNPTRTFDLDTHRWPLEYGDHMHLCWEDIDRHEWSWIIPRRSDTVRSFGYWWAYDAGYKYLMTLDDDCYPEPGYEDLDGIHLKMLERTRWFNTLNNVRPRGTPYKNTGYRPVYINHGLWTNVLDYDAPQQLVDPVSETFTHDNRIVPHGAYFSFCGMNWLARREAILLTYHLLMGQRFDSGNLVPVGLDRMGDIWAGIFMKKICDHLGWAVSSGTPYIHHDRASNPFVNLVKEAPGIAINETLWERVDSVKFVGDSPVDCYKQLGNAVAGWDGEWKHYWELLGHAMVTWAGLFE